LQQNLILSTVANLVTGHRLPGWLNRAMLWAATAWMIAVLGLLLGAAVSLFGPPIRDDTLLFYRFLRQGELSVHPVSIPVVLFWTALLVWALLIYLRLIADELHSRERIEQLERAIHRVPDKDILERFPDFFRIAADTFDRMNRNRYLIDRDLEGLEAGIRSILKIIAQMAVVFSRADFRTHIGANVMLAVQPKDVDSAGRKKLTDKLLFVDKSTSRLDGYRALLYLPASLVVPSLHGDRRRRVPQIALPVPQDAGDDSYRLAIPGAPWAYLTGEQSLQSDTRRMAAECADFSRPTIDEIRTYFSRDGDGSEVRSFVSFRLRSTDDGEPVGVLNIDSNRTHILGSVPDYHVTFFALISPILRLLIEPVRVYGEATRERGAFFCDDGAYSLQPPQGSEPTPSLIVG
jgi:hypothetical protein